MKSIQSMKSIPSISSIPSAPSIPSEPRNGPACRAQTLDPLKIHKLPPRRTSWPDWRHTKLSPKHRKIYLSRAKKMFINAGRAFGKDHIIFLRAMKIMFELYYERINNPNWVRLGPVVSVAFVAPCSKNYEDLWRRFRDLLPKIPGVSKDGTPNVHLLEKDQQCEIFGKNQILVTFVTVVQPDNQRSNGYDIVACTEAGYLKLKTLTEVLMKLVFRPNYNGYMILYSSPLGPNRWWDKAVKEARKGDKSTYWGSWEFYDGSLYDNPTTTAEDINESLLEKAQNIYKYRKERCGWIEVDVPEDELLQGEARRAYRAEVIDACIVTEHVQPRGPFYVGVDLAWSGPDPLTVVVVDDPTGMIVHLEKHNKTEIEHIVDIFERLEKTYKPRHFTYDATGKLGKETSGRLRHLKANPIDIKKQKGEMALHVEKHMLAGSIKFPHPELYRFDGKYDKENARLLLKEVRGYVCYELVREKIVSGKIVRETILIYSKPPSGSDDFQQALECCLYPRKVKEAAKPTNLRTTLGI